MDEIMTAADLEKFLAALPEESKKKPLTYFMHDQKRYLIMPYDGEDDISLEVGDVVTGYER